MMTTGMTDDLTTTATTDEPTPESAPVSEAVATPDAAAAELTPTDAAVMAEASPVADPVQTGAVETTTPEAPAGGPSDAELFEAALAEFSGEEAAAEAAGAGRLNKGDRVEAKVILVEKERVFVDLGTKAEGIIPLNELTDSNISDANELVKTGDVFEVIVLRTNSTEGSPIVSKKRADFDAMWQGILDAFEEGRTYEATVVDRVKGGVVVDIGVRGFVPATHVGNGRLRNLEKFVGQTLVVKIIEVDKERKKVVLSNKVAEDQSKAEVRDKMFTDVKAGDVLEGTVRRLTDYGAFVDLGGIDGLLHISEMSWVRIDHPREVLKVGDTINVKVLKLDPSGGRISLGLRQVLPDPWNSVRDIYKVGQKIKCSVTRMVQSGAFIRLPEGIEAFLPMSEMSDNRIKKAEEAINVGDEIEPMVIDLRPEDRRMVLSLREKPSYGSGVDYRMPGDRGQGGRRDNRRGGGHRGGDFEPAPTTPRAPTGGATIGERLGMLKGMLRSSEGEDTKEGKGE
ncbi:MAG TPA: S1 RNA-binding domain-containing protein [Fimbriimonadaceae bacterium]|nr:S1 RNA-binding domain-containing protein [Fimbriimonadaceae bacterium]